VSSPKESADLSKMLNSSFDDLTYFEKNTQPMLEGLKEQGGFKGGYIVESTIDGTLLWLQ